MMTTSLRTKLLAACMVSFMTLPPSLAIAGPDEADEYYDQASEAYQNGEYARASDLLERAYAEDPNLIYQYNRILALQAMGKHKQALKVLDIYENPMREDGRFDDIVEIREEIAEARQKESAGETPKDTEPREIARDEDADSNAGDQQDEDSSAEVDTPTDPVEPVEPADKGPSILGWSLVGGGAASLAMAGLFGSTVLISDVADRRACMEPAGGFDPNCYEADGITGNDKQRAQFADDQNTWQTHQTLTWVFAGVGVAALAGGGYVLYSDGFFTETEPDATASAPGSELSVTPYVGADGAGGVLRLSF